MPEHVPVTDAELEAKHIGVRQDCTERYQKRAGMRPAAKHLPMRPATIPWVTIVGMKINCARLAAGGVPRDAAGSSLPRQGSTTCRRARCAAFFSGRRRLI
jgi:hypothetical protein